MLLFSSLILFLFVNEAFFVFAKINEEKEDIVEYINSLNTTFTARYYPEFKNLTKSQLKFFAGNFKDKKIKKPSNYFDLSTNGDTNFDLAENFPKCKDVIEDIQVQGNCSSSWAIAVASSIRDRLCIQSGKIDAISAYDIISCCEDCKSDGENGCNGGDHDSAFQFFINQGIVTGDRFQSHEGCKPYPIDSDSTINRLNFTRCNKKCQIHYNKSYGEDKIFGASQLAIQYNNMEVMKQLRTLGSVVARFKLYEDLLYYSGGIYQHVTGNFIGYHYVKVVGYGVDENTGKSYWKATNSYGANWGEDGNFRIMRGPDECGFEADLIAAILRENK